MTRIAIVGPVEPFRSGVARHTTALARALARRSGTVVRVYSFSRQYPALLFPGQSDRAGDTAEPNDLDVRNVIDSINPLTWLSTARSIQRFCPDLVIVPAWTFFLAPCLCCILHQLQQEGRSIVAVVHNVADHDALSFGARVSSLQIKRATGYVTHTRELASKIVRIVPNAKVKVRAHPVLDYPSPRGLLPKRAQLELLMFGLVRPYKGLELLLQALAISSKTSVMLSVVGELWQDPTKVRSLIVQLGIQAKVELVPRYVSDVEAAEYFERTDVVVLPYHSVTGSGVLPLAFRYGKPVAVSRLAGLADLVVADRTGWIVAGNPAALAHTIDHEMSREAAAAMSPTIRLVRRELSFERFADAVLDAGGIPGVPGEHWSE